MPTHGKLIENLTFGEVWNEIKENTARQMEVLSKKEEQGLRKEEYMAKVKEKKGVEKEKYMKKLKELSVLAKELWALGAARRKSGILDR